MSGVKLSRCSFVLFSTSLASSLSSSLSSFSTSLPSSLSRCSLVPPLLYLSTFLSLSRCSLVPPLLYLSSFLYLYIYINIYIYIIYSLYPYRYPVEHLDLTDNLIAMSPSFVPSSSGVTILMHALTCTRNIRVLKLGYNSLRDEEVKIVSSGVSCIPTLEGK
jgi:hypothetical protein